MNTNNIKQALKRFTTNTNLQRRQPFNDVWEIYTNRYLPAPYESLVVFMRVYFEKEAIEIILLRKKEWASIDCLTDRFTYEADENYIDEDYLGHCQQYTFHFNDEETVNRFLAVYQAYINQLMKGKAS